MDFLERVVQNTGDHKILCVLVLESRMINCIRKDFGLDPITKFYDMHVTLVEKLL